MVESERETIARILDEHLVDDSARIARQIHDALVHRRLRMLTENSPAPTPRMARD